MANYCAIYITKTKMIESLLIFAVAQYEFAIDLQYSPLILRADKVLEITPNGYESLDTNVFPKDEIQLIDLKKILQLGTSEIMKSTRILVFEIKGIRVGLLVDEVKYVMSVDEDAPALGVDNEDKKQSGYYTVQSSDKKINFVKIDELFGISEQEMSGENIDEDKINIATIEDIGFEKSSNDLVALSVGVKDKGNTVIITVDRKGNINQL